MCTATPGFLLPFVALAHSEDLSSGEKALLNVSGLLCLVCSSKLMTVHGVSVM